MPGRIEFEFTTQNKKSRVTGTRSGPMCLLVMGDFSGRGLNGSSKETAPLSQRRLHRVDLDNLDQVMGRIAAELSLDLGENLTATVTFAGIDDFHPDSLYRRLPLFDELRDLRLRLRNRDSYREAAEQLRTMLSLQTVTAMGDSTSPVGETRTIENDAATLERLLGKPAGGGSQTEKTARSAVARLIGEAVKAHIVPEADSAQQVYFDAADQALSDLMRKLVHHPNFQALEAQWRSVEFLTRRLELDEDLQLWLLDVSKAELRNDISQAGTELEQSELYRLLIEQGVQVTGTNPWSLIVGQYGFDHSEDDIRLLTALGNIASHAGGPFLAQASPRLLGCESLVETPNPRDWTAIDPDGQQRWETLRTSPVASWIGLALPRLLLRLPYGPDTDEIDSFEFQEVMDASDHQRFLWGNPAIGCALLIGQAFTERGWQMTPGDILDIGGLPAYSYSVNGEQNILPCAEAYITMNTEDRILDKGLMPMVSLRNSNTVRLLRFQSIANPLQALANV